MSVSPTLDCRYKQVMEITGLPTTSQLNSDIFVAYFKQLKSHDFIIVGFEVR